jgi:hypothetical protein
MHLFNNLFSFRNYYFVDCYICRVWTMNYNICYKSYNGDQKSYHFFCSSFTSDNEHIDEIMSLLM